MGKHIKIAIDGPAGSGKSTVSKIIADRLNIEYIDSGAIYRAITKNILDSNIKIDNYSQIEILLNKISIKLVDGKVLINNKDYTEYLRGKEVSLAVSPISSIIGVRKKINAFLNSYSEGRSVIMDGRDIGTVVFPDAEYKFYLNASIEVRALRRFKEKTLDLSLDQIKEEIKKRDDNDKNKEFGALKIAEDAIYIDTTLYSIDEVVNAILDKIEKY